MEVVIFATKYPLVCYVMPFEYFWRRSVWVAELQKTHYCQPVQHIRSLAYDQIADLVKQILNAYLLQKALLS